MIRSHWQRAFGSCMLAFAAFSSSAATSGLIPSAGPVGATLYTDATVLRPLVGGAVHKYFGRVVGQTDQTPYENKVVVSGSGASFVETASNLYATGKPQKASLNVAGGTVSETESVQWVDKGLTTTYQLIELKSPLRAGDRYISLDQRITDVGVDLDYDGKRDGIDVAFWTQVRNVEVIDLPQRAGVRTVRVDLFGKIRARYSTGGTSAVVAITETRWYAEGLGVVKRRLDQPNDSGTARQVVEEILYTRDGVTTGLGFTDMTQLKLSGWAASIVDTASGETHAVVMAAAQLGTFEFLKLDRRGKVSASTQYSYSDLFGAPLYSFRAHKLLMTPYGLRLLALTPEGTLWMAKLTADGQQIQAPAVRLVSSDVWEFTALYYAGKVWVISFDGFGMALRTHTVAGLPVNAPVTLPNMWPRVAMSAGYGRVAVTTIGSTPSQSAVTVFNSSNGAQLAQQSLSPWKIAAPCNTSQLNLQPFFHGTTLRLFCSGASISDGSRQIELDDSYAPSRTSSGALVSSWLHKTTDMSGAFRAGTSLFLPDTVSGGLSEWHSEQVSHLVVTEQPLGASTLTPDAFELVARVPLNLASSNDHPMHVLPLQDRLLVIFEAGGKNYSRVIWR